MRANNFSSRYNLRVSLSPVSPLGLALVSFVICVSAVLLPPVPYEQLIDEPNRMFLNAVLLLLVAGCTLAFALGVGITGFGAGRTRSVRLYPPLRPVLVIIPLLAAILLNLLSLTLLKRNNPDMLTAWMVQGGAAKFQFDTSGGFAESLMLLYAFIWWGLWHILAMPRHNARGRRLAIFLLVIAVVSAVATSLFRVVRVDLFAGLTGALLVAVAQRRLQLHISLWRIVRYLLSAVLVLVGLFLFFSWLRRDSIGLGPLEALVGYAYAPYNRLAALLDGSLTYPFAGQGGYAFRFFDRIPLISRWIDFPALLGFPDKEAVQFSEYGAVARAGLNRIYIWATAYGYLYADLRSTVFIYFLWLGLLCGFAWNGLKRSSALAAVAYGWLGFSVLFWFGDNFVAYTRGMTVLIALILLGLYERVLLPVLFGSRRYLSVPQSSDHAPGANASAHRSSWPHPNFPPRVG